LTPIKEFRRQIGEARISSRRDGRREMRTRVMAHNGSKSNDGLPADRASALTDLITIAEDSVVSRVLAKTGGGNVTLFAFDENQGLSEHTAPFDALVQVIDGSLEVTIGGQRVDVGAGEIVRMPADVPHALHAPEACRMMLTMLRGGE
jgi:quercetin dioxygenase-like cupin family protein